MTLHSIGDKRMVVDEDEFSEGGETIYFATLRIFPTLSKQWILGLPFLSDFYQVYEV